MRKANAFRCAVWTASTGSALHRESAYVMSCIDRDRMERANRTVRTGVSTGIVWVPGFVVAGKVLSLARRVECVSLGAVDPVRMVFVRGRRGAFVTKAIS